MSNEERAAMDAKEGEVFDQELSVDDLDAAAGGMMDSRCSGPALEDNINDCVNYHKRNIYGGGGFPNCASTVEDGSWCGTNDACNNKAVKYADSTHDCSKAWK